MEDKYADEIRELVIARIRTLPDSKGISVGSYGDFTRDDLIGHVRADDAIGKKIIEVEMNFLKALKEGIFYEKELPARN